MLLTKVASTNNAEWLKTISLFNYSFFHTPDCINAIYHKDLSSVHLYYFKYKESEAIIPLQSRKYKNTTDLVTPYGYSGIIFKNFNPLFLTKIFDSLKKDGYLCSYIVNHPTLTDPYALKSKDYYEINDSFVIDLRLPKDELTSKLAGRKKSQVKIDNLSKLVNDKQLLRKDFIKLYINSMKAKGVNSFYLFSDFTLNALIDSPNTFFKGIQVNGKIESISLFGFTDNTCDFLLNGSSLEGRKFSSSLLWEGILHAKEKGIPEFNLGGGMTKGDSLAKFKARFGATPMKFGAFKLIHNDKIYKELCDDKGIKNFNKSSGFFPAYHKK